MKYDPEFLDKKKRLQAMVSKEYDPLAPVKVKKKGGRLKKMAKDV